MEVASQTSDARSLLEAQLRLQISKQSEEIAVLRIRLADTDKEYRAVVFERDWMKRQLKSMGSETYLRSLQEQ